MTTPRPRRTVLYLPASNARAIEKARTLAADTLILDLEDAVAPDAKEAARAAAVAALPTLAPHEVTIRVNGLGTPWASVDFAAVGASAAHALVVPKIEGPADAAEAVARAAGKPVWVLIETPRAIQSVDAIADTPGIEGLIAGFADLAKDLRLGPAPTRVNLHYAMSRIVAAARASNILAFDGVHIDLDNPQALEAEAREARAFGFDGKTCIHPSQLGVVNHVFSPSDTEIANARGLIEAHESALKEGKGVATYKGKMVEVLHVAEARRLLAVAAAVAGRELSTDRP